MNSESSSNIQRTQSNKPANKRTHRANRPVLVTEPKSAALVEPTIEVAEEAESAAQAVPDEQPTISKETDRKRGPRFFSSVSKTEKATNKLADPVVVAEEAESAAQAVPDEQPTISKETDRKRGPRFFSNVSQTEKTTNKPAADPVAARLTRALRGKGISEPKEKEAEKEAPREKKGAPAARSGIAASPRSKSGFKMKYIWGMMAYLLIADFLGIWIADFMQSHGLDAVVFTVSAFQARRSTLVFLALLIIILIVMARLDLIPRSLGAAMSGSSASGKASSSASKAKSATFETREAQPTMKQGVKGADDDLYRNYRENQRYFQKRDRKR